MKTQSVFKGIIVLVLLASIALFNTASFAQFLQDGIDKPPLKTTGGRYFMMHDDEIVGFLTPPENFTEATLRGWMFYPDGSLNLTTHGLDMGVDLNMSNDYFGLTATATGRMHTTDNDGIFVVYVEKETGKNYIRISEYDPNTGKSWHSADWSGIQIPDPNFDYRIGRYIDCATGDVNGDGVDELVIAYLGPDDHPNLFIVRKGSYSGYAWHAHLQLNTGFSLCHDKSLAVTTGDFDGDGDDEVALAVEDINFS